jgi:hypothetical protein
VYILYDEERLVPLDNVQDLRPLLGQVKLFIASEQMQIAGAMIEYLILIGTSYRITGLHKLVRVGQQPFALVKLLCGVGLKIIAVINVVYDRQLSDRIYVLGGIGYKDGSRSSGFPVFRKCVVRVKRPLEIYIRSIEPEGLVSAIYGVFLYSPVTVNIT